MEATIGINMRIDVNGHNITQTLKEDVKEIRENIPILDTPNVELLLEKDSGERITIRDHFMNIYIIKTMEDSGLKRLYSISHPNTEEGINNIISLLFSNIQSQPEINLDYIKKLIKGVAFVISPEDETPDVYNVRLAMRVDTEQLPQQPIHVISHLIAVYKVMSMVESNYWEQVKNNIQKKEDM